MAGSLSDSGENLLLDNLLGVAALASAQRFVGLLTVGPTDSTAGTEVTGGGYTRIAATFTASAAGASSNSVAIVFPTATAAWGTVTHLGIYTAATLGTLLAYADLAVSKTIATGDGFEIPIGDLDVTLT